MEAVSRQFSTEDMADAAGPYGLDYQVHGHPTTARFDDRKPQFCGHLAVQSSHIGVQITASDLTALTDSTHCGSIPRSLNIAMALDGDPIECQFGDNNRMFVKAGQAVVLSTNDTTELSSIYRTGQRTRCLLLQAQPGDIRDEQLAEQLDQALKQLNMRPMLVGERSRTLANELFLPSMGGTFGRLLAESCALELFARAIFPADTWHTDGKAPLSQGDYRKLVSVRDKLLAEPDGDYRLNDLAKEAGLSISSLKAKFPIAFGVSVFGLLRNARLDLAQDGLHRHGWSVAHAAYTAGYRQQSNFSAAYKRRFGKPPSCKA